jgi:hypothetical protein
VEPKCDDIVYNKNTAAKLDLANKGGLPERSAANQLVKVIFEPVFYVGIRGCGPVGLRPQIPH